MAASSQVNFRGSTGFGKGFLHAGDKEWGVGKMQVRVGEGRTRAMNKCACACAFVYT